MPSNKSEVEAFLLEARTLIEQKRVVMVPRNMDWLRDLEITQSQAWDIITRLTPNNYCKGPEADHDGSETFIWVFGATREKKPLYLKLKIEAGVSGNFLKCLSFHGDDGTLRFPLRPKF